MTPRLELAAITDEFSPADFEASLNAMQAIGMTGAELRLVWSKNIMDLTDDEVKRAMDLLNARGMNVLSIASPLLKCVLPDGPALDARFQQDVFASTHTFEDQPRLADRAFKIARDDRSEVHPRLLLLAHRRAEACLEPSRSGGELAEQARPRAA